MRYDEQLGQLPLVISVANQGDHGHKSRRLRQPTGIKIQIRRDFGSISISLQLELRRC